MRGEDDFARHTDYTHYNPMKHGYVRRVRDWRHSSFRRMVRLGVYPPDWAGDGADIGWDFGERWWVSPALNASYELAARVVIIAALERRGVASQTDHWETCVAVFLRAMPKMFGWFKPSQPKKPPDLRARDVADIISRYGELLEKYPTAYMDESWLPAPKEQMRLVFKAAWKMAPTAEMRNHVEVGWTLLSMFQPGVGAVPVDAATPKDASSNDVATTLGKYMKIADAAKPESERDYREMREFTRDPPQRRQLSS